MEFLTELVEQLQGSGPVGAFVAAAIVGLTLAVIVLARFKDLWSNVRDRSQAVDFQGKLLTMIDKLQASEDALRHRVEDLSQDKRTLQEDLDELRVQMALLRHQRRRLIDMLRHVVATLPEPIGAPAQTGSVG